MKAIIEFDLPEDKEEFDGARKASDFWLCLDAIDGYLRNLIKNGDCDYAEKLYEYFLEILEDYNVTLDEYS